MLRQIHSSLSMTGISTQICGRGIENQRRLFHIPYDAFPSLHIGVYIVFADSNIWCSLYF